MIALLRLCRPYYALPMPWILTLTVWYAAGDAIAEQLRPAFAATAALALVIAGGYVLNDVCDWRADAINAPQRPIPAGRVGPRLAALLAGGLLLTGLAVASLCRREFVALLAGVAGLLVVYDLTSKRLGIGKQLFVALLMTSFYPLALALVGESASSRLPTLYVFPIWLFLTSFGYETLKDIRDIRGDRAISIEPTWVQRHPHLALSVARVCVAMGGMVLIVPAFLGCGWVYAAIIPGAIALALWSVRLRRQWAMLAIYGEVVIVGIAALADIIALGS